MAIGLSRTLSQVSTPPCRASASQITPVLSSPHIVNSQAHTPLSVDCSPCLAEVKKGRTQGGGLG